MPKKTDQPEKTTKTVLKKPEAKKVQQKSKSVQAKVNKKSKSIQTKYPKGKKDSDNSNATQKLPKRSVKQEKPMNKKTQAAVKNPKDKKAPGPSKSV